MLGLASAACGLCWFARRLAAENRRASPYSRALGALSGAQRLPDLLVGSENGRVYAYRRAYIDAAATVEAAVVAATA